MPEIRILTTRAELERAATIFYTSLVAWPPPPADDAIGFYEPDRCLGAFADDELVGTATSFTSSLSVPGGQRIPMAAITDVGVLPTHRRQGLAGALIRQQLEDAAGRGDLVATLRASEAVIYERFGYGVANTVGSVEVYTQRARFRPAVPPGGPVRLVDASSAWDLLATIYEPLNHPGAIARPGYWWRAMQQHEARQEEARYVAVHGEPGSEDGFARYQPAGTDEWFGGQDRLIVVHDLVARTERAYLGLLRFLFSIDLVTKVRLGTMPVDHSLSLLLTDGRAVTTTGIRDETWLRLINVEAALAARSYTGGGSVVIDVSDDVLSRNTGRYQVRAGGAARVEAPADLSVDVATLAAAYLGGTPWWQLARAGRVIERTPGALGVAEQLFAAQRAPFSGTMF